MAKPSNMNEAIINAMRRIADALERTRSPIVATEITFGQTGHVALSYQPVYLGADDGWHSRGEDSLVSGYHADVLAEFLVSPEPWSQAPGPPSSLPSCARCGRRICRRSRSAAGSA